MKRSLADIAGLVDGRLVGDDAEVTGVVSDSRAVRPGDLFVALSGSRVDGNGFVGDALAAGAVGALATRPSGAGPVVVVGDPGRALMDLARAHRSTLSARVVGITGSVGKTSVKDLVATVLSPKMRVVASPGSFNTEVGLPLTLLEAGDETEVVVCEMGSRGRGHIAVLCEVAKPDVGVVTGVGAAHLEMFGSLETVRDAKAELVEALDPEGTAILNADDRLVRNFGERTRARAVLYGFSDGAQVRGRGLALDENGFPTFELENTRVELPIPGEHMASNALAACAVGMELGVTPADCATALKGAALSPWRMETFMTGKGVTVINDAYNANPMSVAAALKSVRWIARQGSSIAVLGEMAELGDVSVQEHERIGELAARLGIDHVIAVGDEAAAVAAGALREGVEPERVHRVEDASDAASLVTRIAQPGDAVLVKASRRARLERVADALRRGNRA